MARLLSVPCPKCKKLLESREFMPNARGGARRASDFESCLRRCEVCGIGLSNANTDDVSRLTIIYHDPFASLPDWIREGCERALAQALNVRNRRTKWIRMASSKSEDHATWIVFRFLQQGGILGETLRRVGIGPSADSAREPALLLWGVPVPIDDPVGVNLRNRLIAVSDRIGEDPRFRSEPDVLFVFNQAGVVLIEVKCSSANERQSETYAGWDKYLTSTQAFLDPQQVRATGLYELARNWRIGWDLAGDGSLTLVNLGPSELFAGRKSKVLMEFSECLNKGDRRRFETLTWTELLSVVQDKPGWLREYTQERGLF
jgi:hypothetical protein